MTPSEKLRFVLLYGHIVKIDGLWQWSAAPDKECVIQQMRSPSKWDLVDFIHDKIKEYRAETR